MDSEHYTRRNSKRVALAAALRAGSDDTPHAFPLNRI